MSEQPPFGDLRDRDLLARMREHITSDSELELLLDELENRYMHMVRGVIKLGEDAGMLLFAATEGFEVDPLEGESA